MAILDFANRAELQSIQNDFEKLNAEADVIMKGVASTIEEIKTESVGESVDELLTTAQDMVVKGGQFVIALGGLVEMISGFITTIVEALTGAAADVVAGRIAGTDF